MRVAIYTRVSTDGQSTERQVVELKEYAAGRKWEVQTIYTENASGTTSKRSAFQQMLKEARAKHFDVLLVWKLDRLSRSLKDLIGTLQELNELGVQFVSLKDQIDFTTSAGRLMFHMIGAFAQFETDLIKERVVSGLNNARRKGVILGRPKEIPDETVTEILQQRSNGYSIRQISQAVGVPRSSVGRIIKSMK